MQHQDIKIGFSDEWQAFAKRQPLFIEKLRPLFKTFDKTFIRQVQTDSPADLVVFFLGRLCVEDFMEILLLSGNGYGVGATKLLRGLYERAVTLGYIAKNPHKAKEFLNYYHVHRGKQFNHAKSLLSNELPTEMIKEIQHSYNKAKEKYQEVICKKCNTKRTRFSWSELDLLSMARKVGLEELYSHCYYNPTLQVHGTASALFSRMKIGEDGQITFDDGAQHDLADLALIGAHHIILYILDKENDYFEMHLEGEIERRVEDFKLAWEKNKKCSSDLSGE